MGMHDSNTRFGSTCLSTVLLLAYGAASVADEIQTAPANIQSPILFKTLAYDKNISGGGEVTLVVIQSKEFAESMKSAIGRLIGKSKLTNIVMVDEVPKDKPTGLSVIYLGDATKLEACTQYCRQHKVLSLTGIPDLVKKGITLTVGVSDKKPKIVLNLTNAKKEGIEWDPAILGLASTIE
jgi:hypothetical protein